MTGGDPTAHTRPKNPGRKNPGPGGAGSKVSAHDARGPRT